MTELGYPTSAKEMSRRLGEISADTSTIGGGVLGDGSSPLGSHEAEGTLLRSLAHQTLLPIFGPLLAVRFVIRFGGDEFVGLLQGWVRFWVLDVQVMDDPGDQHLLTTGFKVPPAPAIPRLLRITADVPTIR